MKLKQKIQEQLKRAQKGKKELELLTLRQLLAAIKNAEIDKKGELEDSQIAEITLKEIKKRKEAIELYTKGNRQELAQKEAKEISLLQQFLPEMMSEAELEKIIEKTIKAMNAQTTDFGQVMAEVMKQVKGKAEGSQVAKIVKQKLS